LNLLTIQHTTPRHYEDEQKALINKASLAEQRGDIALAHSYLTDASQVASFSDEQVSKSLGLKRITALRLLASLHCKHGNPSAALYIANSLYALYTGNPPAEVICLYIQALIASSKLKLAQDMFVKHAVVLNNQECAEELKVELSTKLSLEVQ
jgi:hypothetical protein